RARAAQVDVEAAVGPGHLDVEWFVRAERFGQRPRGSDRARERRREDRTLVNRDDVMRTITHEAEFEHIVAAAPCVKNGTAPPFSMRVDQSADGRFQPRPAQRVNDESTFPVPIAREIPMLRLAAAAHAEMRANRG